MAEQLATIEKHIIISRDHADRLGQLAQAQQVSEDDVIARALDLLFSLTRGSAAPAERAGWSALSDPALSRIWDNDEDAAYDNWRELYAVPER